MNKSTAAADIDLGTDLKQLAALRHHDPGAVLGRHVSGAQAAARSLLPGAAAAWLEPGGLPMQRLGDSDVFELVAAAETVPGQFRVRWRDAAGDEHVQMEPYCFEPCISDYDLYLFAEGKHDQAWRFLGANAITKDGVDGVLFAVWAPDAEGVSVIGAFNGWDGRRHSLRARGGSGVWELFVPELEPGVLYKFELRSRYGSRLLVKTDPYGRSFERRPATAALVTDGAPYAWSDQDWLERRDSGDWQHAPLSVYELHAGSWRRHDDGGFLSYRELAEQAIPHVAELGFTHIELLPITEHPLDASWGYQTTGFFAPTSRFGAPDDFRYFIDTCHRHGLGVILDWVAGHFPRDDFALARFDGSALYEHADPRRGEQRDWGTLIFNYGRHEVRSFLFSSARYWIEEFHLDGLRVDAVASMLYLDYSRRDGEWLPNEYGGNENLEAIAFLRELNERILTRFPGVQVIAEESTAWPQVTRPPYLGGLGFTMKWNMGWMHDTLEYLRHDPVHRHYHHDNLTFGLLYAFHENFVLPLSHDEVVHGKGSLLNKMPGDDWQKFANLRLLYSYQYTYPGKKLLFMGAELAARREWDHDGQLDWSLQNEPWHAGVQRLLADLNRLYTGLPALHGHDFSGDGFEWLDCHDAPQSVLCYLRHRGEDHVVVVLNFTPVPRRGYRVGVPAAGGYREVFNSDSHYYGGSDLGNAGVVNADAQPWMGRTHSLLLDLPPLGALILQPES